jgi:hypothetical protein
VGGESRGILSPQLAGGQETTNPRISPPNPVHRRRQVPILPAEQHSGRPQSARLGPPTANSAAPFHPGTSEFLKFLCPPFHFTTNQTPRSKRRWAGVLDLCPERRERGKLLNLVPRCCCTCSTRGTAEFKSARGLVDSASHALWVARPIQSALQSMRH